jgi:SLT domain-containing protein/predicted  nucleic acid-binding Zn-ribbon protein
MELEELEVKFGINLSGLQESIDNVKSMFGSLSQDNGATESLRRIEEQAKQLNETFKNSFSQMSQTTRESFDRIAESTQAGANKASESASKMFSNTKQQVNQDLDSIVSEINSKMEQARAAMERIRSLVNQKASLSTAQQGGVQGVKLDSQIASAQAQMTRYQNQAKALAQQLQREYNSIPDSLHRIAKAMDQNEVKIETLRSQLKRLQTQYQDVKESAEITPGNQKYQKQMTSLERTIMSVRDKMTRLTRSSDELGESYAYIQNRTKPLKTALSQINTSLGEFSKRVTSATSSFEHMGSNMSALRSKMEMFATASKKAAQYTGNFMKSVGPIHSISNAISKATSSMGMFGNESRSAFSKASHSGGEYYGVLSSIKQQIAYLPSMLIVYGLLWNGISSLATSTAEAFEVNTRFANSLETIKDNLLTAFYPIYSYVLPAVNALMSGLEKATSWLAQFSSALTGMSWSSAKSGAKNLKEEVAALNDTSSSSSSTSKAVKEANAEIKKENAANKKAVTEANAQITASNKEAEESYKKEKAAAEELSESLQGFDELNVLDSNQANDITSPTSQSKETYTAIPTESDTSDSDSGDDGTTFTPSNSVFDSAADAANKLKKILGELFDPMKEAWADKGQAVMDAAKYAAEELEKDFEDVGKSFLSVWTNGTGKETMENLLQLVADFLNIIGDIGKAFDEAWTHGNAGTKLIQTIFDSLNDVLVLLHDIATSFRDAFNQNDLGEKVFSNLIKLVTDLFKTIGDIADAFDTSWKHGNNGTTLFKNLLKAANDLVKVYDTYVTQFDKAWQHGNEGVKVFNSIFNAANNVVKLYDDLIVANRKVFSSKLGTEYWTDIDQIVAGVFNTIGNLAGQMDKAWNHANLGVSIYKGIYTIVDNILGALAGMATYTANWAAKLNFTPLLQSINGLLKAIAPLTKTVFDGLAWGYENILLPLAKFTITELIPNFLNLLSAALKAVNSIVVAAKPAFQWFWNSFLEPIAKWTGGVIIDVLKKLAGYLDDISNWVNNHKAAVEDAAKVIITMFTFKLAASGLRQGVGFLGKIADYAVILSGKKGVLSAFFGKITGLSDLKDAWTDMKSLWALSKLGWASFAGKLKDIWTALKKWSVWGKLAAAAQWALDAASDANVYVVLALAIAAIVAALALWYKNDKNLRKKVKEGWLKFKKSMSETWKDLKTNTSNAWELTKQYISTKAEDARKSAKSTWKKLKTNTSNTWDSVKKGTSDSWTSLKENIGTLADTARQKAGTAWSNLKTDTSNAWNTVSSNTQSLWGTISSHVGSGANAAKSNAANAWDNLKSNTSNAWDTVSSNTGSLWNTISSKVSNGASSAKNGAISAWQNLQQNTPGYFNNIKGYASDAWSNISSGAHSLGSNIASGITSGYQVVKDAMATMKKYIIDPIKTGVEKIKDGINWVLNKLGAGSTSWGWFNWANGTASHPGGLAMVNDENSANYRESYELPNGKQGIFPAIRNLVLPLPAGTKIKSAYNTQQSVGSLFPHYAAGIGDFNFDFSGLESALKALSSIDWSDLGSSIWSGVTDTFDTILEDTTHPKKLLDYIVSKFMSYDSSWTDTQTKLAKGGVSTLENGLTSWAQKILNKYGVGSQDGSGAEGWRDAVKKALAKLSLPTTDAYVNAWVKQINTESGGNEKAENLWDSNAKAGHPSKGLLQVIDSTFAAYHIGDFDNIWKGWDNMLAAINYAKHRYGASSMLSVIGHGHGYATGGLVTDENLYPLAEGNKAEMVLPLTNPTRALELIKEALQYMNVSFSNGLAMPSALTSDTDTSTLSTTASNTASSSVQSSAVSDLGSTIVNALIQGLQMATGGTSASNQTANITLNFNVDSTKFGQLAIKGINEVNAANGKNMLNI